MQAYELKGLTITAIAKLCAFHSGMCHRYAIESVTRNRVKISYSNPNEYGTPRPIYAYFPIVLYQHGNDQGTIACVTFGHYTGAGEDYQAFDVIRYGRVTWDAAAQSWNVSTD